MDIEHEYDVIAAFFCRGVAWLTAESAHMNARLSSGVHTDDFVEEMLFHPNGPGSLENILCRVILNELNALIEAALQQVLIDKSKSYFINDKTLVIGASRFQLQGALAGQGIDVTTFKDYRHLCEIKELAEGFKHRQGLRPLPKWEKNQNNLAFQSSLVAGFKEETIEGYDISVDHVRKYLVSVKAFLTQIQRHIGNNVF